MENITSLQCCYKSKILFKNNPTEDKEERKSWKHYLQRSLISGLIKKDIPYEQKWQFFDRYLVTMEIIPYHSTGITFPPFLSKLQLDYLLSRFENSIDFIIRYQPKIFIFNGNPWYILLIKNKIIKNFDKVSITEKFNLYFFTIKDIPCILFDKLFRRHYWGITNEDREKIIPSYVNQKYSNLFAIFNQW